MARPRKKYETAEQRRRHEAALERRKARYKEKKTIEMASKAAEGDANFDLLLAHEQKRLDEKRAFHQKGGTQSPKIMSQARQDLADAFDLMGGVPALVVWGREHPTEFYRLWSKLIPATAPKETETLPLETLLSELATREEMSVRDAAIDIGQSLLEKGRKQAELEDLSGLRPEDIN